MPNRPIKLTQSCHASRYSGRLACFLASLLTCGYFFPTALANAAKITRASACKVQISGGDFEIGEVVPFSIATNTNLLPVNESNSEKQNTKNSERSQKASGETSPPQDSNLDPLPPAAAAAQPSTTYMVKITKSIPKRNQWVGEVQNSNKTQCQASLGASLNNEQLKRLRRAGEPFQLSLSYGQNFLTQKGLNWAAPKETQSLPAQKTLTIGSKILPLAMLNSPLLSDIQLDLGYRRTQTPATGLDDGLGAKTKILFWQFDLGLATKVYLLGDKHPSYFRIAYAQSHFATSHTGGGFGTPLLRSLKCNEQDFGIGQEFFAKQVFRINLELESSVIGSCKTNSITASQAVRLEAAQFGLGRAPDTVIPANQIANAGTIKSPTKFGLKTHFTLFPISLIGIGLGINYSAWSGELPTEGKKFGIFLRQFLYEVRIISAI